MTSKERAQFRSKAQALEPVVMVGKDGISEGVVFALTQALEAHELVKLRFQDFKEDTKAMSNRLAQLTESELIATTGFTAVFWKKNPKKN